MALSLSRPSKLLGMPAVLAGCGGNTASPAHSDADAGTSLGTPDSGTVDGDTDVEPASVCEDACALAGLQLQCDWWHGGGPCFEECYARSAGCPDMSLYLTCVLGADQPYCLATTVGADTCADLLSSAKDCPVNFDAGPPPCEPGEAQSCDCEPPGFGVSFCDASGKWGPCTQCKR